MCEETLASDTPCSEDGRVGQSFAFFMTALKNFVVFFEKRWDSIGQCMVTDTYKIPGDSFQNTLTPSTVGLSKDIVEPMMCVPPKWHVCCPDGRGGSGEVCMGGWLQEQLWMGFQDVQWKLRIMGSDFTFSRGLFITGVGSVDHPVMLELTATFAEQAVYPQKRPRILHLFYCTEVPPSFKERAVAKKFFQGPVPEPQPRGTPRRPWTPGPPGAAVGSEAPGQQQSGDPNAGAGAAFGSASAQASETSYYWAEPSWSR
jgi:hypothetical protein